MSIELMIPSNQLILCHPFLLLPSVFPSIRVFSNESVLRIRWPKYWSFSFSISPSNEYLGLIFFRMDWFDLLAVQETLKSLLLYHSSKASILQRSAFFMVQLSHPYMTTGKTIALTRWIFVFLSLYFTSKMILQGLIVLESTYWSPIMCVYFIFFSLCLSEALELTKNLFGFFHNMLKKNWNKLFDQPKI